MKKQEEFTNKQWINLSRFKNNKNVKIEKRENQQLLDCERQQDTCDYFLYQGDL